MNDSGLADYIARRFGTAPVSVVPLTGDASTRRYYRLNDGAVSTIAALYPEPFDASDNPFLAVRGLLAGFGIPVPEVLEVDAANGVVMQQDLGDATLQAALETSSLAEILDLYHVALSDLARLHQEGSRRGLSGPCFRVAFDIEKLSWELHYFEKHFLEGLREADLSVEDRSALAEGFHRLCEEIASWPRVLCHRDFHSRNLMVHEGRLYWIDFQDARMGPATYDLASLLRDSYVELPAPAVAELMERFRQNAVPRESREAFARRFDLVAVQRNLKALGTFGYMVTVRQKPVYLQYVPRTLGYLRQGLPRHPELAGIHRVLARHLPEI